MKTKQCYFALMIVAVLVAWTTGASAAILYTAEGDSSSASDTALADGAQNGTFSATGTSVSSNAAFGSSAFNFASQTNILSTIEIAGTSGTSLGSAFTLAAFVDATTNGSASGAMQRVFSNFAGSGGISQILILDMDPDASANFGLRVILNGTIIKASSSSTAAAGYDDGAYHHVAMTYNNGAVKLYLDGVQVGGGTAGSGTPDIGPNNLFLGEDAGFPAGEGDQFIGDMDDVLVLTSVLSTAQILDISNNGAGAYASPPVPEPSTLALAGIGLACLLRRTRR